MKKQVLLIHGGDTFETYDEYLKFLKDFEVDLEYLKKKGWKRNLQERLGDDYEVIAPIMPNKSNAKYLEWKIWFEKFLPFIQDNVILVGHSLGGIFLAKYLSEDDFPKKIQAVFLVAAPFDAGDSDYSLADFILANDLNKFETQSGVITLYHSTDDPVVPFLDFGKYRKVLPKARGVVLEGYGHFTGDEFPQLVEDIRNS